MIPANHGSNIDNNWVENRIRPIALGRQNWLFAGSLRAGKRAAAMMSLIHSAKLNGLDPYVHIREVLERLPTRAEASCASTAQTPDPGLGGGALAAL